MNVLIVFSHPESKSLNSSLKSLAADSLEENGHQVKISDLYGAKFKATIDREDFLDLLNSKRFQPILEQCHAAKTDSFASEIKNEMEKVKWANLIIFQFPVWNGNIPAILKGWFDRILTCGFSSDIFEGKIYDKGLMRRKKAMLSFTTGGPEESYYMNIPDKDPAKLLPFITEILKYSGFDVLKPFIIFNAMMLSEDDAEKHFEGYKKILGGF
ncbi:NAD(P)H dehydrogenase (quinone) [Methanobacterium oryzae]